MNILVACEYSGVVRDAFAARGHFAMSCDLLPSETPGTHHQGDVRELLTLGWDMIIAHPPCTRLCNSGVRWLHERNLWGELREAAEFFSLFLNADCPRIAVENPVMHKYARALVGRGHDFTVQPYEHGDPFTKRTCFWTRGLKPIEPTNIVSERYPACHLASPGKNRAKERSKTYPGIANAMAKEWA